MKNGFYAIIHSFIYYYLASQVRSLLGRAYAHCINQLALFVCSLPFLVAPVSLI